MSDYLLDEEEEKDLPMSVAPTLDPEEFRAAREESDRQLLYANLMKAGAGLGAAIGTPGMKADTGVYDSMISQAQNPINDLKTLGASKAKEQAMLQKYLLNKNLMKGKLSQQNQEQLNKDREFLLNQKKFALDEKRAAQDAEYKKGELQIKSQEKKDYLTPEDKAIVATIAPDSAQKMTIANQIDESFRDWDSLSDTEKVYRGRSLLKLLNSDQGKDAVGAEEVKRLGAQLEFAFGNLTNANPMQFGRDLDGFKKGALEKSKIIKSTVAKNIDQLEQITGRPSKIKRPELPAITKSPINPETNDVDLNDQRVKKALESGYTLKEIKEFLNAKQAGIR